MDGLSEDLSNSTQRSDLDNDQRVYFVPYRWWKDAEDSIPEVLGSKGAVVYTASTGSSYTGPMKLINNIFSLDLVLSLRREDDSEKRENGEAGVSGRDYALVPSEMWVQALRWHSDSKVAMKNSGSFSAAEDDISDVYPLKLRLSVLRETNSFGIRICKKENAGELFKRACKIFGVESELVIKYFIWSALRRGKWLLTSVSVQLRIWDLCGQTISFFTNEKNKFLSDCQRQSDHDIILELQVYGLSDSVKSMDGRKVEFRQHSALSISSSAPSLNGCVGNTSSNLGRKGSGEVCSLGLTGLQNLGNTCFMNSALQCLAHTPKLVDYFLGDYGREINHENPLGMDGEIALAFGDLLRKLWAPGAAPVAPRLFKSKLARFAPQFSGYNQHDSQELLAFLLDGLHEDLNRVKCKPYIEAKDEDGRPDGEVANEYWQNHLARNNSIIVDVCQGQYKSTLVCPVCKKISVTFDPFMYLSLPLPSTIMRTMTLTVLNTNGDSKPSPCTITVPKYGKCKDLIKALGIACSLGADETLLVAEIYNNRIIRYLEEPADSLSLIRDDDRLVAYRLAKDIEQVPLVVFINQRMEEQYIHGKLTSSWKAFGVPLVASLCGPVDGSYICNLYLKLLNSFRIIAENPAENPTEDFDISKGTAIEEVEGAESPVTDGCVNPSKVNGFVSALDPELQFYLTDEKGIVKHSKLAINEPVTVMEVSSRLYVLVCWPESHMEQYDTKLLCSLPEVFKSGFYVKRPQESISLYKCLEAFLQEEPLGPEDMWYCPGCEKHCQAIKKLDLWRLPEILVIHLKRFSYSRFSKNKLETYVDFPVDNFDLSPYISQMNSQSGKRYVLYAVSNHYGSMGGGHYTAFVHVSGVLVSS
ncbi:hypothetical protein I3760_13G125300 [Carya illinoinensis]|nr:hypothetical protein I3760_13G125300 [Carya illinoinensis]